MAGKTININANSGQDSIFVLATPTGSITNINTQLGFPVDQVIVGTNGAFNAGAGSLSNILAHS